MVAVSSEDAQKLDEVREALRKGDLKRASQLGRVYQLTPRRSVTFVQLLAAPPDHPTRPSVWSIPHPFEKPSFGSSGFSPGDISAKSAHE